METNQSRQEQSSSSSPFVNRFLNAKIALLSVLIILVFIELGFMTFWRGALGNPRSAFVYFGVQVLISILPFVFVLKSTKESVSYKTLSRLKGMMLLAICLIVGWILLRELYLGVPDFAKYSDVIPQVQYLSSRFLHFEYPYEVIKFDTYDMTPTYLPMHWMPYCAAVLTNMDPRWVSYLVFGTAWIYMLPQLLKSNISSWGSILALVSPLILISAVKDHDPDTWRLSVELLITGYYLLLGLSLLSQNLVVQRLGLVLCLLSRYSLVFWLPVYAYVFFNKYGFKKTAYHFGIVALACIVLYLPFFINDPQVFSKAQTYYNNASVGEWSRGDHPYHLYNGLGFAQLYYEHFQNDLLQGILAMRKTLFVLMPLLALLSIGLYYKTNKKINEELFLIGSLKLSLAFFYSFVQIPYSYLYLVPMIISIPLLIKTSELMYNPKDA